MNLAEKAVQELFPERDETRQLIVKYSGKFSSFNANVKYSSTYLQFSLSRDFLELSEEVRQGVIEYLLCKVYGTRKKSTNQDLYHAFMKNLSNVARIEEKDDYLLQRFQLINEQYFNGMLSEPNLRWGKQAYRKLGHYEYAADTIVISSIFRQAPTDEKTEEMLDFVLYHEMLHKKHQYNHRVQGAHHHTKAFKEDEKKWHDQQAEKKLSWFLSKKRLKKMLLSW
ncbi:hypothetical protein GF367_00040 [Candidatus Woesearchaeota archaeon]|nr:hypothetical protein [Candidatus Woesearchaeota archaeon]